MEQQVAKSSKQRELEKFFRSGKASAAAQAQTLKLFAVKEVRAFNLAVMAEIYNRSQNRFICNPHQPNDFIDELMGAEQLCAKREDTPQMLWIAPFVAAATDLTVHRYYGRGFGFSFNCDGTQKSPSGVAIPFSRLSMNFFNDKAKKASAEERKISFLVTLVQAEYLLHPERRIPFPDEAVESALKEMQRPTLFSLMETGYQPERSPEKETGKGRKPARGKQKGLPIYIPTDLGFLPR